MEYSMQLRLRGDYFNGHFTNGMSMAGSESVLRCKKTADTDDMTVYEAEEYRVTAHHIRRGAVTECYTVFENISDRVLTLDMLSSFCIDNIAADTMHRATSFWSAEGKLLTQPLTELNMEPSWSGHGARIEKFGQVGSMPVRKWFPFIALQDSQSGEFLAVQMYCPSSWQMELIRYKAPLMLVGGLADYDYGHWCKEVQPGNSFCTPKAMVATGDSLCDVCDKLVKAQTPRIAAPDRDMPVIFNEYCTTWGNPTVDNIERIARRISGSGIKYLVIDSGWYKEPQDDWWATIGDWNENRGLFPNGIKALCDRIRSYGLIPGIWFEFEKVAWQTELYNRTEHLLMRDGVPLSVDGQRFLDMRDDWCIDYLTHKVIDFLRDNGFGYIKIDYNDTIGIGCDGAESPGEGLRQTVLGTQGFFRKISAELPDLVIEGCSSGGHRLEPSFLQLVSQSSFSDAHECTSIPLIAANLHRLVRPEQSQIWAVLRSGDDIHRIYYSLCAGFLGRLCLSGEIFDLTDEHWQTVLDAIAFYDRIKDIIRDGTTTIIDTNATDYSDPHGHQVVLRELGNRAVMVAHTFADADIDIDTYLTGWTVDEVFGSDLTADFRAAAYVLHRSDG